MAGSRSKFLTLINSLPVVFPDQSVGAITPAVLRDFLDSFLRTCFIPDATLTKTIPGTTLVLTANVWAVAPAGTWQLSQVDASGDLTADTATGTLTGHPTLAGCDYGLRGDVSVEGAVNTELQVGFFRNGADPTFISATLTLQGAGKDQVAGLAAIFQNQPAGTFWQLGFRAPAGGVTITIDNGLIGLALLNTWQ